MEKVAVTGATGYVGEKLVEKLILNGNFVHAIARNEGKLIEIKDKYKNVEIFPCPVEDEYLIKKAVKDCSGIYHLASFKEINLAEKNALKTVQTNIFGTLNILKASVDYPNIHFVIVASSDKAEKISGVYGATKFIMEKLVEEFNFINQGQCKYRILRFGNILHSTSSVLVKWKKAILEGKDLVITDPSATRYFLTREEAVAMIFECLETATDSKPYFTKMKSLSLKELLDMMILKYGNGRKNNIIQIGLREGENKHEKISPDLTSEHAIRWNKEELYKEL